MMLLAEHPLLRMNTVVRCHFYALPFVAVNRCVLSSHVPFCLPCLFEPYVAVAL